MLTGWYVFLNNLAADYLCYILLGMRDVNKPDGLQNYR